MMANPYIFIGICDIHILTQCNGAMEDRQNNLVIPSKKIYGLKLEWEDLICNLIVYLNVNIGVINP